MENKKFIGKITEKVFNDGGQIINISLSKKDVDLLKNEKTDFINIAVKKSRAGTWYAEVTDFTPNANAARNAAL